MEVSIGATAPYCGQVLHSLFSHQASASGLVPPASLQLHAEHTSVPELHAHIQRLKGAKKGISQPVPRWFR